MTRSELVALAEAQGLDVPARATKKALLTLLGA